MAQAAAAAAGGGRLRSIKRMSDEDLRSRLDSSSGGFFGGMYQKEFERRKNLGNFGLASAPTAGGTSDVGGKIEGLESRITALESGSGSATTVAGVDSPEEAAATAEAMGGSIPPVEIESAPITTGRFSESAQNTANSVFGTEAQRSQSLGQIPAGLAGGGAETVGAIADLMNENV
jgi:hypothetical protein